eukprot:gene20987-biopygen15493
MLRNAALFIWDEVSMIPGNALRAVDFLLRDITHVFRPFDGKFMPLRGDFRQVLPVISRAGREKIVAESLKSLQIRDLWASLSSIAFTETCGLYRMQPIRNFQNGFCKLAITLSLTTRMRLSPHQTEFVSTRANR